MLSTWPSKLKLPVGKAGLQGWRVYWKNWRRNPGELNSLCLIPVNNELMLPEYIDREVA